MPQLPREQRRQLDEQQVRVLQALLDLELQMSRKEFDALWQYAVARDFRSEFEPQGPLRKAIGF